MPLKVWLNTALGCNHQSIFMPQLQPSSSAALVPMYYPKGMKARVSLVQSIEPRIGDLQVQSSNHYTTVEHQINAAIIWRALVILWQLCDLLQTSLGFSQCIEKCSKLIISAALPPRSRACPAPQIRFDWPTRTLSLRPWRVFQIVIIIIIIIDMRIIWEEIRAEVHLILSKLELLPAFLFYFRTWLVVRSVWKPSTSSRVADFIRIDLRRSRDAILFRRLYRSVANICYWNPRRGILFAGISTRLAFFIEFLIIAQVQIQDFGSGMVQK